MKMSILMILSLLTVVEIGVRRATNSTKGKSRTWILTLENANESLLSANEKLTQERDEGKRALMNVTHIQDQVIAIIKEYTSTTIS